MSVFPHHPAITLWELIASAWLHVPLGGTGQRIMSGDDITVTEFTFELREIEKSVTSATSEQHGPRRKRQLMRHVDDLDLTSHRAGDDLHYLGERQLSLVAAVVDLTR